MKVRVNDCLLCLYADTLSLTDPTHMVGSGDGHPDFEKLVAEPVAKSLPVV